MYDDDDLGVEQKIQTTTTIWMKVVTKNEGKLGLTKGRVKNKDTYRRIIDTHKELRKFDKE